MIRNVSGPGTITFADLLFVGRGSQLFFFFPDELGPGTPGSMFINRGRVVEYLGEPRKIVSQSGVQEDLCATLSESSDGEAVGAEASESSDGEPVVGEPVVGEPVVGEPVVGDESQIPLERLA